MRPACARLEVPSVGEARAEPSRESSPGSAAARWPAGAGATRAHRGSGASTRPFHAAFACVWRPRALSSTSASVCRHEHNHGPLEPPCRRQVARPGGCFFASPPVSRGVAQPPKRGRVRGRGTEPRRSPSRLLAPETSPQPRSLQAPRVASAALCPGLEDTGRGRRRRRCARLRGARTEGSCGAGVPRRIPIPTNPRGLPSQGGSNRAGCAVWPAGAGQDAVRAFFTTGDSVRGTLARAPEARPRGVEEWRPFARLPGRPQRPLATSAFE